MPPTTINRQPSTVNHLAFILPFQPRTSLSHRALPRLSSAVRSQLPGKGLEALLSSTAKGGGGGTGVVGGAAGALVASTASLLQQAVIGLVRASFLEPAAVAGPATSSSSTSTSGSMASASARAVGVASPAGRGEAMMALLMSVPLAESASYQGGGGGGAGSSSSSSGPPAKGLLPAANARFGLDAAVSEAIRQVWISVDRLWRSV